MYLVQLKIFVEWIDGSRIPLEAPSWYLIECEGMMWYKGSWLVDQIDACPFYQVNMEEYQAWRWVLEVEIIQFKTYWIWGLYNSLKEPSMLELRRVVCAINRVALYLTEMVEPA